MQESSKQNYLHGAAMMTAGVVVIKILGAIYKIPLGNILGDEGYGYFSVAYNIYYVFQHGHGGYAGRALAHDQ